MARVEDKDDNKDTKLREELKREVRKEMRRGQRRARWGPLLGCLLGLVLFLLIIGGGAAFILARTGLVEVPVLSSRLYTPPAPTRVVEPEEFDIESKVMDVFTESQEEPGLMKIALREGELTAMFQEGAREALAEQGIELTTIQAAILEEFVELYFDAKIGGKDVRILARVLPKVEDGLPKIEVLETHLGGLPVHPRIIGGVLDNALDAALGEMGDEIKLESIELNPGVLEIILRP